MSSEEKIYQEMSAKFKNMAPDSVLREKARLVAEINELKKEKNAVILGHNYMEPALYYFVPDIKGDSLELARKAAETDSDIIVFCGVEFMAETAKILNPSKKVLIPSDKAGCSLAESITADDVRSLKKRFPGLPVVTYINTYAEVKAETDICCTSGNAEKVVQSLGSDKIIFIPDEYLSKNIARETGKRIIFPEEGENVNEDFDMIGWKGRCEVHEKFTVQDIINIRKQFPDVTILAHPECSPEVTTAADFSGSTSAMIKYVKDTDAPHYLLLTECSMGDNIAAASPQKEMLRLCSVRCPYMKEITLEDTLEALKQERYEITVPEDIRIKALESVQRMLDIR